MDDISTVGIDLAKSGFQIHGVGKDGAAVLRRQLRRRQVLTFFENLQPCLISLEACSGSHYWARATRPDNAGALREAVRGERED